MSKLTDKEREGFNKILSEDLNAINKKFMNQIKEFWGIARDEVMRKKGWDKLIEEKNELEFKRLELRNRIHEIENIINEEPLRVELCVELGGSTNDFGRCVGAHFYGIPITSQFEYEIVEYMRENIDLEIPSKIIRDICLSSVRVLTIAGTFEEAREAYEKFYSLDFRKYGVDIFPRLDDIRNDQKLIEYTQKSLQQIETK